MIYLPGGMGLFYAVPLQATPATKITKQTIHQLHTDHIYGQFQVQLVTWLANWNWAWQK